MIKIEDITGCASCLATTFTAKLLEEAWYVSGTDNIPSVVVYSKTMKNGKVRTFSITDKQAVKILAQYEKDYGRFEVEHLFVPECKDHMSDVIYRVVCQSNTTDIKRSLTQNIQLMLLHVRTIPEPILNSIYEDMRPNEIDLHLHNLSQMERILEGTGWTGKGGSVPDGMDPFSGLKLIDDTKKQDDRPKVKKLSDNNLF